MALATVILKTNASQATPVLIQDLGLTVPAAGGTLEITSQEGIRKVWESLDLFRTDAGDEGFVLDDNFGAGSSTIIINDGTSDIPQDDAHDYIITAILAAGNEPYGVVSTNGSGEIVTPLTFTSPATLTGITLGGDIDGGGFKLTNIAPGTAATDAVNFSQLQAIGAGLVPKNSVRLGTVAPLPTNTAAGTGVGKTLTADANGILTIDGVTPNIGDRILVKNEQGAGVGADVDNGIYVVTDPGTAGSAWVLTRSTDMDEDAEAPPNAFTFVSEGATQADTGWFIITDSAITVDTTPITWDQFNGGGSIIAGAGLTKTGNQIDVGAGTGVQVNANDVEVLYGVLADINSLGAANAAGILNLAARADHTHEHGDRGGDAAGSQHDADQIDVEGTYGSIGAPGDLETVLAQINANFEDPAFAGKYLQYGLTRRIPGQGEQYLFGPGPVATSSAGQKMLYAGTITGMAVQVDRIDSSRTYSIQVLVNGVNSGAVSLASGVDNASTTALAVAYAAGDELSFRAVRTAGSGRSTFGEMSLLVAVQEG